MPARAYILIEAKMGQAREVLTALRAIDHIIESDIITGSYDLIAVAEAQDMRAMVDLVAARVQNINGVQRTITCVAV